MSKYKLLKDRPEFAEYRAMLVSRLQSMKNTVETYNCEIKNIELLIAEIDKENNVPKQ